MRPICYRKNKFVWSIKGSFYNTDFSRVQSCYKSIKYRKRVQFNLHRSCY
jgi:hypothetical protein